MTRVATVLIAVAAVPITLHIVGSLLWSREELAASVVEEAS